MKILVSACLLGDNCKYDGGNNLRPEIAALAEGHELIPVCPEVLGGLPTPRTPAEIADGRVITRDGRDVTAQFRAGAEAALAMALRQGAECAILQPRSPSCGVHQVYDGTFTGTLAPGAGVCAALLAEHGIRVLGADDFGLL